MPGHELGGLAVYVQYARRISRRRGDRQPREALPRPRRARRRRARAAGRPGDRAPRDGADRRADRRRRARSSARATRRGGSRTRRPTTRSPSWPRTLDVDARTRSTSARTETEATLARQREFVADASHELRTPLTSVLANLELLEETLEGEQREAAASALRSSRRMRRLVADLLLLARADAGRDARHAARRPGRASSPTRPRELEPVAGDHEISVSAPAGARSTARATSCTGSC